MDACGTGSQGSVEEMEARTRRAMTTVIEYLESFNRKERFFLVGAALGNTQFQLGAAFRERVGAAF